MTEPTIIGLLISALFTENFVLVKFLGCCPFLGVSKKLDTAVGMGRAVTFVMAIASMFTYLANKFLLVPLGLEYLQTILFILIIAALVQFVEMVIKKTMPALYSSLGIYLPLITTNCAVLGVTVLNISESYTMGESLVNAFGAGIGFLVAMMIFSGVRGRMESCDIPKSLQGLPITLIAASITALTYLGFGGIVENLFA